MHDKVFPSVATMPPSYWNHRVLERERNLFTTLVKHGLKGLGMDDLYVSEDLGPQFREGVQESLPALTLSLPLQNLFFSEFVRYFLGLKIYRNLSFSTNLPSLVAANDVGKASKETL